MPGNLNLGIAFLAGVLSFLSPCVLPLIPSYLSMVGGTTLQELRSNRKLRKDAFVGSLFFVLGFSIVFVILGFLITTTFGLLGRVSQIINLVAGSIVIILGLNFIFNFWKLLNIEKRFHIASRPAGSIGSFLFGVAFGAGWSPCIGPILGSILLYAGTGGNFWQSVFLLLTYSLGLGLPFLLAGVFIGLALRQIERIKPHLNTVRIVSGLFLVLIGVLILLGRLQKFNAFLFSLSNDIRVWERANPVGARALFGVLPLFITFLVLFFYIRRIRLERAEAGRQILIRPVRIALVVLLLAVAVLSFTGFVSFSGLLSSWLNYQGI
jgi:cytochrome c-type biogenesis protein